MPRACLVPWFKQSTEYIVEVLVSTPLVPEARWRICIYIYIYIAIYIHIYMYIFIYIYIYIYVNGNALIFICFNGSLGWCACYQRVRGLYFCFLHATYIVVRYKRPRAGWLSAKRAASKVIKISYDLYRGFSLRHRWLIVWSGCQIAADVTVASCMCCRATNHNFAMFLVQKNCIMHMHDCFTAFVGRCFLQFILDVFNKKQWRREPAHVSNGLPGGALTKPQGALCNNI